MMTTLVLGATAAISVGFSASADDLASRLRGRMLLQVEAHGEAWWVNPDNRERIYLSKPSEALEIMRGFGIGVSDADLARIPVGLLDLDSQDQDGDGLHNTLEDSLGTNVSKADTDGDGVGDKDEIIAGTDPGGPEKLPLSLPFASTHSGRIFLQVESRGEAWWVNPDDLHRYYLGRPAEAFAVMRSFGIGVSDADLSRIAAADSPAFVRNAAASPPKDKTKTPVATTSAEKPAPSGTVMPALAAGASQDCGDDFACLAAAVTALRPAASTRRLKIDDGRISADLNLRHSFRPTADGRFALVTRIESAAMSLSTGARDQIRGTGLPAEKIAALASGIVSAVPIAAGNEDWCLFRDRERLRQALARWQDGIVSHADLDYATCCSLSPDGSVDRNNCDADFPVSAACLLTVHPSRSLNVGDVPDEWVTRFAGRPDEITWESGDQSVLRPRATRGSVVTVEAVSAGETTVTVRDTAAGPGCSVSYTVNVSE